MINSNRSSIIVSDKLKHENKVVSSTSIKSIMNELQTGSKCQNNTDSGQFKSSVQFIYSPSVKSHIISSFTIKND